MKDQSRMDNPEKHATLATRHRTTTSKEKHKTGGNALYNYEIALLV